MSENIKKTNDLAALTILKKLAFAAFFNKDSLDLQSIDRDSVQNEADLEKTKG